MNKMNKKIKITESQLREIKKTILKEQDNTGDVYRQTCKIDFNIHNLTYKGFEVDDVGSKQYPFTFQLTQDHRSYGIKGINIFNLESHETLELEITYYENDEQKEAFLDIPINWGDYSIQPTDTISWIGIDDQIDITLSNDKEGNIIIKDVEIWGNEI